MYYYFKHLPKSRWILLIPLFVAIFSLYLLAAYEETKENPAFKLINDTIAYTSKEYTILTRGCRIPYMDPFKAAKKYTSKRDHLICNSNPPLVESNQTHLFVVEDLLKAYNVTAEFKFECCYMPFWRKKDEKKSRSLDDSVEESGHCYPFNETAEVRDEFVKVTCSWNGSSIYKDIHAFIVPKKLAEVKPPKRKSPSVLIIGIDSVSRLNFVRQMPKTRNYLLSLNAFELLGYNKVGENTFPNLVPALSGYDVSELGFCWNESRHFDDCPWIWDDYHKNGYVTAFAEDSCWIGIFNYLKKGFHDPPTDYYGRTYMLANENQLGHHKYMNAHLCAGNRVIANILLDYAYKFSSNMTFSKSKYWGLFWESSLTHDDFNIVPETDIIYVDFLKKLKRDKVFENTVVFFMSDHGIRWGAYRQTFQGRMEERLPFMYVVLPKWLSKEYPRAVSNLQRNTKMLTTPFDVHETLRDLLNVSYLNEDELNKRMKKSSTSRGISLFMPIPSDRTCEDADITPEWCTCYESHNVSISDPEVISAAENIVSYINKLLFTYIQCSHLYLNEVISAEMLAANKGIKSSDSRDAVVDYLIVIETTPGLGRFEARVRHNRQAKTFNVLEYVSRVNAYGSQSACVFDYHMRLYCYCNNN